MESRTRTVLKTLSWRVIAAVVTGTLTWAATGSLQAGAALGAADTIVKLFIYYAHERAWTRVTLGYQSDGSPASTSIPTDVNEITLRQRSA